MDHSPKVKARKADDEMTEVIDMNAGYQDPCLGRICSPYMSSRVSRPSLADRQAHPLLLGKPQSVFEAGRWGSVFAIHGPTLKVSVQSGARSVCFLPLIRLVVSSSRC